jgi:alpha-galactosidase
MDGSAPGTLDSLVRPVYRELRRMGWRYFKVDALRHLRYEGYNSYRDAFRARGVDPLATYRGFVQAIRDEVGPDAFILGSWGIRPELVGVLDACRVGDDGFGFGGFAEYNSFNNVVWRNDPDHIELTTADAFRATMATSLTGSLLMLTDRPEVYRTPRVEAAKRAAPVLFTLPGQLYDVDPSRSQLIGLAGAEVSGAGPRPFDADQAASVSLYLTDVTRPFEQWAVLGRTGGERRWLRFTDLGLAPDSAYLVFEFWSRTFRGALRDSFDLGAMDPRFGAQLFCLRAQRAEPQVVATTRHVTCGGVDLVSVSWSDGALTGESDVVGGDAYAVYVTEPAGYRATGATADGARVLGFARDGTLRVLRLLADESRRVSWTVRYARTR